MIHGFMCCSYFTCCCPLCRHRIEIKSTKQDKEVGKIRGDCHTCCSCFPSFSVYDEKIAPLYTIKKDVDCCASMFGGCACCCCAANIPAALSIHGVGRKEEGKVEHMARRGRDEDTFKITFPREATDAHRLLLVGATFLVDYALYDDPKPSEQEMR